MQHESERWMFAQFLPPDEPAELFSCCNCGHWSENGFAILRESKPGSAETTYSVYCSACDSFGPKAEDQQSAIEQWNMSSLTQAEADTKRDLAFALAI